MGKAEDYQNICDRDLLALYVQYANMPADSGTYSIYKRIQSEILRRMSSLRPRGCTFIKYIGTQGD